VFQHSVPDQATLLALLSKEGYILTQGTLSRRLARLSIGKTEVHLRVATKPNGGAGLTDWVFNKS
jgi:arginine repressor